MEVRIVVALLLLGVYTVGGKAQVECYSEVHCPENQPALNIGEFDSVKECCILGEALSWQSGGDPCAACLIYGWKGTYFEARIGDTVTLTVGTIKGSPEVRVILGVEYNDTEVSVNTIGFDPALFIWAVEDLSLQVTVLDDGQPLQEDKNITLTLVKMRGGHTSDIVVTEAIIAVRAQKIPVMVGFNSTGLTVSESDGLATACVTAIAPSPTDPVTVNVFAIGGTATAADIELPFPATLTLIPNSTQCVQVPLIAGDGYERTETFSLLLTTTTSDGANVYIVRNVTEITILDSDIQTGFRTPGGGCIPEGVLQEICLTTVGSPAVDTVLTVSVTYGTAGPEDFDLLTTQVTITGTMTEPCVSFQAIADDLGLEEVENLTLSLSEPPNVQLTTATLHICIQDSDVVTFEFFGEEAEADEDELEIDVTITRSVATAEEVSFTLTPTEYDASFGFPIAPFDPRSPNLATPGADYVPDVIQFTIPPGDGPTVIPVPIIDDVIAEDSDQYFIGVLSFSGSPTGAVLGRDAILTGIQNNDQATIRFQFLSSAVDEQDVDFTHNLLVTRDVDSEQNYSIALSGSSNTAEDDDFFVSDDTFYFPPDVSSINVSVTIRGDTRIELAETFDVRLRQRGGPNFVVDPLTRLISVGIRDNDGDYIYVPAQSTYTVPEGEQREVSFVLDNPPPNGVFEFDYNVVLSTADGSATGDSDYISIAGDVIAASTMPNGVVSVNVGVLRDDRVELEETFSVVGRVMESGLIANGIGRELPVVFQSPLNVSIVNQDVVSLRFAAVAVTVTEGGSQLVCLEPVMTDVLNAEFTVQLSLQGGTATGGVDYASEEVTVTIGPPVGSGSPDLMDSTVVCIDIDTATDTDIEGAESLTVMGTVINNADLAGFPDGDTVSITILDTSVVLGVEQIMYEVSEADGSLEVCAVVNNGTVVNPVTISVSLSSVSATEGDDYVLEDEVVTLDAGSSVGCATIRIVSDDLIEGPEDFNVEITTDDAFAVISNGFALVTITGELAMIEFDQATYTVMEGDLNPTVDVCVTVGNGRVVDSLTVSINLLPTSTATEGQDFDFTSGPPVIIEAGDNRGCLQISVITNEVVEPEEEIRLAINTMAIDFATFGSITETTVVILRDGAITIGFGSIEYTVDEGGTLEVVVVKSAPFDSVIEFEVAGGNFSAVRAFPDGASSPDSISIFFQIPDDIIALEPAETISFTLTVLNPNPQISVDPDTTTVTILDNDCPVTIGFDEANIIVSEDGGGDIEVAVSLLQPVAAPVSVDFNYILETAGFDDFVRTGLSRLTFTENGTQTIPLGILDDDLDELEMETFSISLFNPLPPDCVTISPDLATITIIDDDEIRTPPPFVNTTVVGDPFFTAPVQLVGEDLGILPDTSVSLCYELHGRDGAIFSLVNDQCTLVNAHYTKALPEVDVNVIDAVYIRAKDSGGVYRKIAMSLSGGCSVTVDNVTVEREYDNDDIRIRRNTNRVRVSVPNCNKTMFVMWMICENRVLQATGNEAVDLIKFVIARGSGISESAHGLLGQMFNVPFSVRTYTGELGFLDGNERHFYMTVGNTLGGVPLTRTFVASLQPRIWDRTAGYCLYAGNRQSGPTGDVDDDDSPNDSVIEGVYTDYIVSADFATDCIYCGLFGVGIYNSG